MSVEDATAVMRKCTDELRARFMINHGKYILKIVDKDGVRVLPELE
jgi:hypothetical protein